MFDLNLEIAEVRAVSEQSHNRERQEQHQLEESKLNEQKAIFLADARTRFRYKEFDLIDELQIKIVMENNANNHVFLEFTIGEFTPGQKIFRLDRRYNLSGSVLLRPDMDNSTSNSINYDRISIIDGAHLIRGIGWLSEKLDEGYANYQIEAALNTRLDAFREQLEAATKEFKAQLAEEIEAVNAQRQWQPGQTITLYRWQLAKGLVCDDHEIGWSMSDQPDANGYVQMLSIPSKGIKARAVRMPASATVSRYVFHSLDEMPGHLKTQPTFTSRHWSIGSLAVVPRNGEFVIAESTHEDCEWYRTMHPEKFPIPEGFDVKWVQDTTTHKYKLTCVPITAVLLAITAILSN
jgi:hypothetical protein